MGGVWVSSPGQTESSDGPSSRRWRRLDTIFPWPEYPLTPLNADGLRRDTLHGVPANQHAQAGPRAVENGKRLHPSAPAYPCCVAPPQLFFADHSPLSAATAFLIACAGQNFGGKKNLQTSRGRKFDICPPQRRDTPFRHLDSHNPRAPAPWRSRKNTARAVWISGTSLPRKRATVPVPHSSLSSLTRNMASSRRARFLSISALRQE